MKKLLLIMVLISATGFAAELTADTVATPVTWGEWAAGLLALAVGYIAKQSKGLVPYAVEMSTVWLKSWNHWRGNAVVIDTGARMVLTLGEATRVRLLDGSLSDKEIRELEDLIAAESTVKLKELYGFYKKDLEAWAKERAGVFLGKFLLRNSNSSVSGIR